MLKNGVLENHVLWLALPAAFTHIALFSIAWLTVFRGLGFIGMMNGEVPSPGPSHIAVPDLFITLTLKSSLSRTA